MSDSIYHMTLKYFEIALFFFSLKMLRFGNIWHIITAVYIMLPKSVNL